MHFDRAVMRRILALLSHGESTDATSTYGSPMVNSGGGTSVGLLPGKQVVIDNQRFTIDAVIAEGESSSLSIV